MPDTWTVSDAAADWSLTRRPVDPLRVALWEAINEYATACGGDTGASTIGVRRMEAVVAVERAVRALTAVPVYRHADTPLVGMPSFWLLLLALLASLGYVLAIN